MYNQIDTYFGRQDHTLKHFDRRGFSGFPEWGMVNAIPFKCLINFSSDSQE